MRDTRHPARRAAIECALCVLITATAAVFITKRFNDPAAPVLVALLGGIPSLHLALRALHRDATEMTYTGLLADMADRLAPEVLGFWERERRRRRLESPFSVPWQSAPENLVHDWSDIERMATDLEGSPDPVWMTDSSDLAGTGNDLANLLSRIPTRRLVVLGDTGSGKTALLVRLAAHLANAKWRQSGGPVPFLVSLATWNPSIPLRQWLTDQLISVFPELRRPYGGATGTSNCAEALLEHHLLILILDGLDEIPQSRRRIAVERINEELDSSHSVIVASRLCEYRNLVHAIPGHPLRLKGAPGIILGEPEHAVVRRYLLSGAGGGSLGENRWGSVVAHLGSSSPTGLALRTPLLISLANAVYNPHHSPQTGPLPDPCTLLSFPSAEAIRDHLLDELIAALYRPALDPLRRCPWTRHEEQTVQVTRWLKFLATLMDQHPGPAADRAWWYLEEAVPRPTIATIVGVAIAIVTGAPASVIATLLLASTPDAPSGAAVGCAVGLVCGLTLGVLAGSGNAQSVGLSAHLLAPLGSVGRSIATAIGVWAPATAARRWLAIRRKLPWNLSQFLHDAHEHHEVLRRVGPAYEFRHIELQHRLAA